MASTTTPTTTSSPPPAATPAATTTTTAAATTTTSSPATTSPTGIVVAPTTAPSPPVTAAAVTTAPVTTPAAVPAAVVVPGAQQPPVSGAVVVPGAVATTTPYQSASLYVGDLRLDVTESALFDIFKNVGTVASIRVCKDALTRRSLGYAYVNFHNAADAERALDTMNYTLINQKPCRIMWSHRDPARRRSGAGNIFIKNLDKTVNNQQLYDTFSAFGNILSCKVETDDNGNSKGYGYVHFEKETEARSSIEKVNGMMIQGKQVFVGPFLSRRDRYRDGVVDVREERFTNVYIKNLEESVNEEQLVSSFSKFGEITSSIVMRNPEGVSRCFGFVNFKEHDSAKKAQVEMNGQTIGTKQIVVCRAQSKLERARELQRRYEQVKADRAQHAGVNIYVRNLEDTCGDEELRQLFAQYGTITSVKVMRDEKEHSKGFGFVSFTTAEEAHKAISEVNGMLHPTKPLYVALAQKKEVRKQQLEAQHAHRVRSNAASITPAYMPQTAPIFYGGPAAAGMPGQRWYPPPMMRTPGWRHNYPISAQIGGHPRSTYPQIGYVSMSRPPRSQTNRRPAGQTGGMISGQMKDPSMQTPWRGGYRLSTGARNQGAYPPGAVPVPVSVPVVAGAQVPITQEAPITVQAPPAISAEEEAAAAAAAAAVAVDFSSMSPEELRQAVGERLYGIVYVQFPGQSQRCGKITGMLLESMDINDLIKLLEDRNALSKKIDEANQVHETHQRKIAEAEIAAASAQQPSEAK